MNKPMVREHNLATNEIIDREMTTAEFAKYKEYKAETDAEQLAAQAEAESKAARRQLILDKLGLTNDETQLLLG
jgi:hypothetical protein